MTADPRARQRLRIRLRAAAALVGAVAALPIVATTPAVAGTTTTTTTTTTRHHRAILDYQSDIFARSNQERREHGRAVFRHQWCVQQYAMRQAARMAAQERMFHQDLRPVLRNCHLRKVGENVAYGFLTGLSVVTDGWMESPDHRANLLDPDFRLLGTGARLGADGLWYAVQVFGRHL